MKPVKFYEMPDGLWYPQSDKFWNFAEPKPKSDRDHYIGLLILEAVSANKKESRHLFRRSGMVRHEAYKQGKYISSSVRGFHKSRIEGGFEMFQLKDWRADYANWRLDHEDKIEEIERILTGYRESIGRIAQLLAD